MDATLPSQQIAMPSELPRPIPIFISTIATVMLHGLCSGQTYRFIVSCGSQRLFISVMVTLLFLLASVHCVFDLVMLSRLYSTGAAPLQDILSIVDGVIVGMIVVLAQLFFAFHILAQRFDTIKHSPAWRWHVLVWALVTILAIAGSVACVFDTVLIVKDAEQYAAKITLVTTLWLACNAGANLCIFFSACIVSDFRRTMKSKPLVERFDQICQATLDSGFVMLSLALADLIVFEVGHKINDHLLVRNPLAIVYVMAVVVLLHNGGIPSGWEELDLPYTVRRSRIRTMAVKHDPLPSLIVSRPMSLTDSNPGATTDKHPTPPGLRGYVNASEDMIAVAAPSPMSTFFGGSRAATSAPTADSDVNHMSTWSDS